MRDQSWTGDWVAERLLKHTDVEEAEVVEPQIVHVTRNEHDSFSVGTIAMERVEVGAVLPLINGEHEIGFIMNVPSESFWTGEAISAAAERYIAFGGLGDLYRAIRLPFVGEYENKEFSFVERGLRQHSRVHAYRRLHDRLYRIERLGRSELTVVLLNEYELTADHVRNARDRYGAFDTILITNPNGGPTSSAVQAAESIGADIHKWAGFFGRLNLS